MKPKRSEPWPERDLTFINRGISGEGVADLAARWNTDTLALKPDVLSLLVGINDTLFRTRAATPSPSMNAPTTVCCRKPPRRCRGRGSFSVNPSCCLSASTRPPTAESALVQQHQAAVHRLGAKYHLPVVAYQRVFEDACKRAPAIHWSWDGVHPTYAGRSLMAQAWLQTTTAAWDH